MEIYNHHSLPIETVEEVHAWLSDRLGRNSRGTGNDGINTATYGSGPDAVVKSRKNKDEREFALSVRDVSICDEIEKEFPWIAK